MHAEAAATGEHTFLASGLFIELFNGSFTVVLQNTTNTHHAALPQGILGSQLVIGKLNYGIITSTEELHCADSIGLQIFHHDRHLSL